MVDNVTTISWFKYGWEVATTYGTVTTSFDKVFGHGLKVGSLSRKNNVEDVYGCGTRNAQKLVSKKFEGSLSPEFKLSNPWFFYGVMGTATVSTQSPYTHTFTEADTIPSFSIENNVSSATKSVAKLLGCKIASCTITAAVNELAQVKLDILYANETHGTSTSAQVAETFDVFNFAEGSLELPDGTTIAKVQSAEVTTDNTAELLHGLGSRFAADAPVKNRVHTGKFNIAFTGSAQLEQFYGTATAPDSDVSEVASMELIFDNGEAATATTSRNITMTYTGLMFDTEDLPQDPTALVLEDLTAKMRALSVTARNATSVMP